MAWKTLDRNTPVVEPDAKPLLSAAMQAKIRSFFERYESKRAALLPALHIVQEALGHVPHQAMIEIADLLEIAPSQVLDTLSFYTHYWDHPRGKKIITVCRSLSCELLGGAAVLEELKNQLGIDEHGTSADGRYSLVTEECLAGCDHAPCLLINEKLHKYVKVEDVGRILADADNDKVQMPRSDLYDPPPGDTSGSNGAADKPAVDDVIETTSDIQEMKESE